MTKNMHVIKIIEPGGPSVLTDSVRPIPKAGFGQVVIKVAYAGINRPDVLQRAGLYKPPPNASDLPGLEASGTIVSVGPGVNSFKLGETVCALLPGGGYAEQAVTQAAHCLPVPPKLSLLEAACLPETFFTVWSNVFMEAGLSAGDRFLVHGGSSGIGTTAIQLASIFGARVFSTAGTTKKCATCLDLGAERAINYRQEDFVEVLKEIGGADVILDMVGGDYISRNLSVLSDDGRLVQIAFLKGAKVNLNLMEFSFIISLLFIFFLCLMNNNNLSINKFIET